MRLVAAPHAPRQPAGEQHAAAGRAAMEVSFSSHPDGADAGADRTRRNIRESEYMLGVMSDKPADDEADRIAVADRGESTGSMEPLLLGESSRHRTR